MRQVHYSMQNSNSIDLVFFVNGIPVATAELKTDFTQNITDAVLQYKNHRPPRENHCCSSDLGRSCISRCPTAKWR